MSTLIAKELVTKSSSPARYEITEAGCQLAECITASEARKEVQPQANTNVVAHTNKNESFQYWYVSFIGKRVFDASRGYRRPADGWYLGICKRSNLLECAAVRYDVACDLHHVIPDIVAPATDSTYVYIHPDDCPPICTPPSTDTVLTVDQIIQRDKPRGKPIQLDTVVNKIITDKHAHSSSSLSTTLPNGMVEKPEACPYVATDITQSNAREEFTLHPRTFDIILYVDISETNGNIQNNRKDDLIPELRKNGVPYEIRKLHAGDFLWIARERKPQQSGVLPLERGRELVLDYIIERKRMDDLAGSIIDGRFREQKFRLKLCGINNPIYLVEEFGSMYNYQIPASTLMQAAVNTQVIDNFYVKKTRDLKESAAYLTVMTRYLQRLYSSKQLISCSRDDKKTLYNASDICSSVQRLMVFDDFNVANVKTKVPSVYELFCKQLMQFARMTTEKVVALTDIYKTPQHLLKAYASCHTDREKELLLSKIKYGKTQSNLGPALSKSIYYVYCSGQNALR